MSDLTPVRLEKVLVDEVGQPRNDGTPGSALYVVPVKISSSPPSDWATLFQRAWQHPSRFTSMHRPDIARVSGNRIILDGTTIEEVEKYHAATLKLAVDQANREYEEHLERLRTRAAAESERRGEHEKHVRDIGGHIKLD